MQKSRSLVGRLFVGALLFVTLVAQGFAVIGVVHQMQLGNPSSATTTSSNHVNYLIQRDQYAMDYNDTLRVPNWVSWDLTSGDVGSSGRSSFAVDPDLPAGFTIVQTTDYSGSGFDRGHMCPSADRTVTVADNQIVFFMTNMVPQAPDNNQGVWASFETECRNIAAQGNELLITCGPSGFSGSTIASGVSIPGYVWKIVVVVPLGSGMAVDRIDANTRVIAIKIPNVQGVRSDPWQNYITSAAQIEADTGYTFFSNLPPAVAAALRVKVDGQTTAGMPAIVVQPADQTAGLGGSASFSVTATGDAPLSYQWSKDDAPLAGATSSTLVLTDIAADDVGSYTVTVSNNVGSVTSSAAQLIVNGLPPTIATPPATQTVSAGNTATFSVSATGSPTLTYQWRKGGATLANGGNISGATSATLTVANAQLADVGSYDVVVTNSVNFATSAPAGLFVNAAGPTLTSQPVAQTVNLGSSATFSVAAKGSDPLTYQWRKDGVAIADNSTATTASLVIASTVAADAGSYDCIVNNAVGPAVTSNAATLTVNTSSVVTWNFTTATPSSGLPSNITGGTVTQNNNNGTTTMLTTTSASNVYAGASGSFNAGAAARIGALNTAAGGSAYFEFTLTPTVGQQLVVTGFAFGSRSTSTGPQAYYLFSSVDGFAAPLASGTLLNNSAWALQTASVGTVTGALNTPVTFRLYGANGTGSPGANTANWRIDDLKVTVATLTPAPTAPAVDSTTPANGASGVAQNASIAVNFTQPVSVASGWFSIQSSLNGSVAATVTGGPTSFLLTPPVSFTAGDTVTVTIFADKVSDLASGTLHPAANYVTTFSTSAPIAPSITTPPQSQTVATGESVSFTVAATGSSPLTYQWRKDGAPITGNATATSAIFTIASAQPGDAGSYDVVVTNGVGSATSAAATLTVTAAPAAPVYWDFATATPTSGLPADVTGGAVTQNNNNGTTTMITTTSVSSGYAGASGTFNAGAAARIGALNQAAGGSAYFEFTLTPAAGKQLLVSALSFGTRSTSTGPKAFAVLSSVDGFASPIASGTLNSNSTWTLQTPAFTSVTGANGAPVTFRLFGYNGAGSPGTGTANWRIDDLKLTVATIVVPVPPSIVTAPAAQTVTVGDNVTFSVAADGTGPLSYQWRKNGDAISGANASSLALASVLTDAAGSYDVVVTNSFGSATSAAATLTVNKATATVTLADLAQTYTGAARAVSATTEPAGLAVEFTYDGNATAPVNVGSYAVVATVNDANYTGTASGTLVVAPAAASVTLGDLSHVYDGSGKAASVATSPAGIAVTVTYDGASALPVNAGDYAVVATIADPNFAGAPASATLTIAPATATVTLGALEQVYDGTPRTAAVATTPAGLAVNVTYDGAASAPTNVGTYAVVAMVNEPNYVGSAGGTLKVTAASATIALSNLTYLYDGTPKSATVTTTPASLPVTVTYNGNETAPTLPGVYTVVATTTDANHTGTATAELVIDIGVLVRRLSSLNGGIDGAVQVLGNENITLNGSAWISGDLLVAGTPTVKLNGQPAFGGTTAATGAATPSGYTVTLNGGSALHRLVTCVDPLTLPVLAPVAAPAGTRSVTLNNASQSVGDFATLRNLTLNGSIGSLAVPAGRYGAFTVNGNNTLVLGVADATEPAVYDFQSLTLNGNAKVVVLGPVIVNLPGNLTLNGSMGTAGHAEWLEVNLVNGSLTLNGSVKFDGYVAAPQGTVTINGSSALTGGVAADKLVINGNGVLVVAQ